MLRFESTNMKQDVKNLASKRLERCGAGQFTAVALIGLMSTDALASRVYDEPRKAGLGALADVGRFTAPSIWLRQTTHVLVSKVASGGMTHADARLTGHIESWLGRCTNASPGAPKASGLHRERRDAIFCGTTPQPLVTLV